MKREKLERRDIIKKGAYFMGCFVVILRGLEMFIDILDLFFYHVKGVCEGCYWIEIHIRISQEEVSSQ